MIVKLKHRVCVRCGVRGGEFFSSKRYFARTKEFKLSYGCCMRCHREDNLIWVRDYQEKNKKSVVERIVSWQKNNKKKVAKHQETYRLNKNRRE